MAGTDRGTVDGDDATPRIVREEGVLGGDPRIEGTRVGVFHVYRRRVDGGDSPEEIAAGFDVSVAAVHAALAYAFAHPGEMDAIADRNRQRREAADALGPGDVA